jgi:hypothetical protein
MLAENAIELCFQSVAAFAHDCDLASESIFGSARIAHSDIKRKSKAYECRRGS